MIIKTGVNTPGMTHLRATVPLSDQGQRTPAFRSINSELASLPSCGSGDGSTY